MTMTFVCYKTNATTDKSNTPFLLSHRLKANNLFIVPPRCQDDLYCMVAILLEQYDTICSTKRPLGRYPYLVTNDRLHDHISRLQHATMFRQIYQCHAVHYRFDQYTSKEGCTEVQFVSADQFLQKIQVNSCPPFFNLNNTDAKWSGKAWHFPVKGWSANERFVIRIPEKYKNE